MSKYEGSIYVQDLNICTGTVSFDRVFEGIETAVEYDCSEYEPDPDFEVDVTFNPEAGTLSWTCPLCDEFNTTAYTEVKDD